MRHVFMGAVRADFRTRTLLLAMAVLAAGVACGEETASETPSDRVSAEIGPAGGKLAFEGDGPLAGTRLEIPAGALAEVTTVVLEGTRDPTSLATLAQRIGPQVRMSPEGLALAQPAALTLPLDPEIVERYGQSPAECRVWQRDDAGWKRIEQSTSTERTVTVPISALRTAAAGLVVKPKNTTCGVLPLQCGTASLTCSDPTGFCLRRLAAAPVPADPVNIMSAGARLFYDTVPGADRIGLVRYDLDADAITVFRPLLNVTRSPSGQPALDASGRAWLAVPGVANVAFSTGANPVLFDTVAATRVGSVVEVDGTIHRLSRPTPVSSTSGSLCWLSPGSSCVTISGAASSTSMFPRPRLGSAAPARFMAVDRNGIAFFDPTSSGALLLPVSAAGMTMHHVIDARPSATDGSVGVLVQMVQLSDEVAVVRKPGGGTGEPCALPSFLPGTPAVDTGQTVWIPSLDSPELASCSPEGGLSFLQLTTAAVGTAEHSRMIPVAVVAVPSRDRLVVATRGTSGVELYELRRAQ